MADQLIIQGVASGKTAVTVENEGGAGGQTVEGITLITVAEGASGTDTFVLGDSRGLFYNDGDATSARRADYALIKDFIAGGKIQLSGSATAYIWGAETPSGVQGSSIFQDTNHNGRWDSTDEFIAHVEGSAAALNLTTNDFVFA